jgi:hypothetical protein
LAVAFLEKGFPQGDWKLDWPMAQAAAKSPDQAKLLLNLICLAQDCLPRGGTIAVRPEEEGLVAARGELVTLGESVQGLGAADLAGLGPRSGQGAYTGFLAARLGKSVAYQQKTGEIVFTLRH